MHTKKNKCVIQLTLKAKQLQKFENQDVFLIISYLFVVILIEYLVLDNLIVHNSGVWNSEVLRYGKSKFIPFFTEHIFLTHSYRLLLSLYCI